MIRLHILGIPYTITREEYSHCAFTGQVQRFSPMMRSRGFEVFHYGVETSESGANRDVQLFTKEEWTRLRIETIMFLNKGLTFEEAENKNNDNKMILNDLSNWSSPLTIEFNKRLALKLKENYRSKNTDIVCLPLGATHDAALKDLDVVTIETAIGYSGSKHDYRVFVSYSWLSHTLGVQKREPHNYWFVIPNYFDINAFRLSLDPCPTRVGFMGRITLWKGCHVIVEIAKKFPHIQFILCGAGDPTPFLASPNIVYKDPIHGSERSEYLGSCVALLHPTKYLEPFGNAAVEAQLCGTPVIASDYGAMVETIEPFKTGFLCHTLADYCYGVQMALDGKFDRRYIRERAAEKYDMYKLAPRYEYVFRSVLDIYDSQKNGWYSPDPHIKVLVPKPRIYKFLVYYGAFPNYFQLYLDSLEMNKNILTVFLVTDIDVSLFNIPPNLVLIQLTLDHVRERISRFILDTYNTCIEPRNLILHPYKLVDFKIVFPILFDDIIRQYKIMENDYVGWGDCDLIYGNFERFIDFDDNYGILGGWHGHFTAIRNTESFKNNFIAIPDYLKLITDNTKTHVTDEIAYREPLKEYLKKNNIKMFYTNRYFCDVVPACYYHMFRKNHKDLETNFFDVYHPTKNISYLLFNKQQKSLSVKYDQQENMEEVFYCHLQKRKMDLPFAEYSNGYYINENSFSIDLKT